MGNSSNLNYRIRVAKKCLAEKKLNQIEVLKWRYKIIETAPIILRAFHTNIFILKSIFFPKLLINIIL